MKRRSGFFAAREQLVWIAALIGSTAIVVQLERLELQKIGTGLSQNPFAATAPEAANLLEDILAQDAETDIALTQYATALTMRLMLPDAPQDLRAQAAQTLTRMQTILTERPDPVMQAAFQLLSSAAMIAPLETP